MLDKCWQNDSHEWKVSRFIKDPVEIKACWTTVQQNFVKLKDIFTSLIARSNFPNISINDFEIFSGTCQFFDKNVSLSTIGRLFISSNYEVVANDENPDRLLCRYEFFELLLRIANAKYRETGLVSTFNEAFKKLLNENVFPNFEVSPWQEFRDHELWSYEV